MSNTDQSEIDELLALGRRVRELLTIEEGNLENCLNGLFSIAQRLNKEDDMIFVAKELIGYSVKDKTPLYRQDIFRNVCVEDKIIEETVQDINHTIITDGILKLQELVKAKEDACNTIHPETSTGKILTNLKHVGTFSGEVPWSELSRVISGCKLELISRINSLIGELAYGKVPQGIFKKFQDKVNAKLIGSNSKASSALEIAFESLGKSEDPERISTVAFACRRLVKAVADSLIAPENNEERTLKDGSKRTIGEEQFLNRIEVFVDSLDSPNSKYLLKEVKLLRDLMNEIPESMNAGIHLTITNDGAERLVLKSYIILGSILMEKEKIENAE